MVNRILQIQEITKEDLLTAEEEYSNYAYRSLLAELKPEFEKLYQSLNSTWNKRTAGAIARRTGNKIANDPEGLMMVYAAGGMIDEYLASLYVRKDPTLVKHSGTPEDVACLLSKLWLRVVFGADSIFDPDTSTV